MTTEVIDSTTICDAIASTFRTIAGLTVQSYNELSDGVSQTPLLQVWWINFAEDPSSGSDRSASGRKVVISDDVFTGRLFAQQRSELARDVPAVMKTVDAMRAKFYEKSTYFGLPAIKSVRWQAVYRDWRFPDDVSFAGARFTWTVRIY